MNRTIFVIVSCISLILASCSGNNDAQLQNQSLAKSDETVIYEVSLEIDPEASNWMGNIDQKKLLKNIFSKIEKGEIPAYGAMSDPFGDEIGWNEILSAMDASIDTVDVMDSQTSEWKQKITEGKLRLSEIKSLIFVEEWSLDKEGILQKKVLGIAPIRHYFAASDSLRSFPKKRIPFIAYFGDKRPELFESY